VSHNNILGKIKSARGCSESLFPPPSRASVLLAGAAQGLGAMAAGAATGGAAAGLSVGGFNAAVMAWGLKIMSGHIASYDSPEKDRKARACKHYDHEFALRNQGESLALCADAGGGRRVMPFVIMQISWRSALGTRRAWPEGPQRQRSPERPDGKGRRLKV